uniref:Uncharacterized protein n=1 Tax=Hordeum vulgare subsp. vulgare TaxID=112509 RepID=A0A8I6WRT5_HORVV
MPPRRSLSVKHIRFAERLERIRSRRWGGDTDDAEAQLDLDDTTLWTKTILLGERCRVPTASGNDAMIYRPRHPRSVPVTRSNSFAGVLDNRGGSCRPAGAHM